MEFLELGNTIIHPTFGKTKASINCLHDIYRIITVIFIIIYKDLSKIL